MEINIEQEKIDIIKNCIETNERYSGNEDLYEDFFAEVIKRGFIIFKNMDLSESSASVYLNKIVSSAIISVLENSKRIEFNDFSASNNKTSSDEQPKTDSASEDVPTQVSVQTSDYKKNKYENVVVAFDFAYTPTIAGGNIKSNVLQKIYDTVVIFNSQNPGKEYLQLYNLRYLDKLPVSTISQKLNMPQKVIVQNLFELMEEVKKNLEQL
ncbi:hypothetical protein IJ732_01585 [bacterium]|nr:hypothetical protein [bacterium]